MLELLQGWLTGHSFNENLAFYTARAAAFATVLMLVFRDSICVCTRIRVVLISRFSARTSRVGEVQCANSGSDG
jgi:hypothetical protein